jgi:nucleotide-binding universal stress UspA family protein
MERVKLILVPVDGSPDSLLGLSTASRLARTARAAVVLLRVVVRSRCGFTTPIWG